MNDLGTCQIKLDPCSRTATVSLTMRDVRNGSCVQYLVCREHAELLTQVNRTNYWQVEWEG